MRFELKKEKQKTRNAQKGQRGLKRICNAFFYSLDGIKAAWSDEEAFRQIAILAIVCIIVGLWIGETWVEKILLILPCVLCVIIELVNSAIENIVDFVSLKFHPLAKKAKDMGSALQLIACLFWLVVWISYIFIA